MVVWSSLRSALLRNVNNSKGQCKFELMLHNKIEVKDIFLFFLRYSFNVW